ncbi:MAG: tetratricopeptide repeat protein, partial [Acidobacteriia bacterium]|nr:tetratricopeptide repeat protein [Terriglobia bacterium]
DPNNGRAYSGMGVSYRNLDNREEAEKYLKIALSKSGQMSERERYRTRGAYYVTIKNYEKAADEYKTLIAKFPADNVGLGNLALCYTYLRDLPDVIVNLQKAVAIYPKDARQRMNLAEGYLYGGRFEESAREADEVLKLNPAFERAYVAKAVAALAIGKPDQAAAFYEEAGKVGQRYRSLGLADLALFEGRAADAAALLEKGIQSDLAAGRNEWAALKQIALGQACLLLGRRPAAIAAASAALQGTSDQTLTFLAARVLLEAGDEARARAVAERLSKELYNEPLAYGKLLAAEVDLKKGQLRDAIRLMLEARSLVDTWIGHYDLGRAYLVAGAWPEADSEFDACIARRGEAAALDLNLDPTYSYLPPVYYYSGRAKQGIGSPAAADAFRTYLGIKAKADHDPLLADARKRVAK